MAAEITNCGYRGQIGLCETHPAKSGATYCLFTLMLYSSIAVAVTQSQRYDTCDYSTTRDEKTGLRGSKNSFTEKWVICMIFFPSVLKSCSFPYFSGKEIFGLESPHSTEWAPPLHYHVHYSDALRSRSMGDTSQTDPPPC